jgi:uncharacterized protein YcbX
VLLGNLDGIAVDYPRLANDGLTADRVISLMDMAGISHMVSARSTSPLIAKNGHS